MSKNTINAAQLTDLLRNAQITVAFTKTDGSERHMRCTLQDRYLPELNAPAAPREPKTNHNFVVWDLDEAGWRSFRVGSVISVSIAGLQFSPAKSMLLG
jgi:hypothetical protein